MQGLRVTQSPTSNAKLVGGTKHQMYATYRAVGHSCHKGCSLLNNGCYAQSGNVALQMRDRYSNNDGDVFLRELDRIPHGAIIRLHVSGDVMTNEGPNGSETLDVPYIQALIQGAKSRPDVTMYGYTHSWRMMDPTIFPPNLIMNASCDTPDDVRDARSAGWQTTTVVASDTEWKRNNDTVICPNQTIGVSCAQCKLCMRERPMTIAFKAHGSGTKKVNARIKTERMELPML